MKRGLIIIIKLIILTSSHIFATEQITDILIMGKDTFYLKSFPLEMLRNDMNFETSPFSFGKPSFPHTGCYRGYVATWKIIDNKLILTEVTKEEVDSAGEKLNIVEYLKKNNYEPTVINGLVFADWYSDSLKIYRLFLGTYLYDFFILSNASYNKGKTQLLFENGYLIKNNIPPFESYKIGDTLSLDVVYYDKSLLNNKTIVNVKGKILDKKNWLVKLKIMYYSTDNNEIIESINNDFRTEEGTFWTNPRYWEK